MAFCEFTLLKFGLKSKSSTEGILKQNVVLPFKFEIAKSPRLITSIPIKMSPPVNGASVTLRKVKITLFGNKRLIA
jgi:hypothetical protein